MLTYIIKRCLLIIPTLIVVSLITFYVSINAPGDPASRMLHKSEEESGSPLKNNTPKNTYDKLRHE